MVNEAILEGLKRAVKKGETLRQAMMTFYNAGYPRKEIEQAARLFQAERAREKELQMQQAQGIQPAIQQKKPIEQKTPEGKIQKISPKVSDYGAPKKDSGLVVIIILSLILVFLIACLIGVFAFKTEIIEFFNKLF